MAHTPGRVETLALDLHVLRSDFRLQFERQESRERFAQVWSRCVTEPVAGGGAHVLDVDEPGHPLSESRIQTIGTRIAEGVIADLSGGVLLLRTPAVADDDGRVLAVVAGEGARPLSLVLELARTGMTYVTTDLLSVGDDGSVKACPQPVQVVEDLGVDGAGVGAGGGGWSVGEGPLRRTVVRGPNELGLREGRAEMTLSQVVVLEAAEAHGGAPRIEPLPLIDALMALAPLMVVPSDVAHPLRALCQLIERCGGVQVLIHDRGQNVTSALRAALVHVRENAPASWKALDDRSAETNEMAWRLRDGRVRPAPVSDAVELDGEAVVLVGSQAARLGPLGLTLWRAAGAAAGPEQLEAAAAAAHGEHPDASALVRQGVDAMRAAGVVGWGVPLTLERVLAGAVQM